MTVKLDASTSASLRSIQQQISDLDLHAKKDQNVQSSDFGKLIDQIDQLDTSKVSADMKQSLLDDVKHMQTVAGDTSHRGSDANNAAWSEGFADINKLINDMGLEDSGVSAVSGGHGPGTAFKNLTADQAKEAGLPDAVAAVQDPGASGGAQQVNKFTTKDNKDYYVASDNSAAPVNFTVYDSTGKNMGTMKAPAALGLNDGAGSWLAVSKDGLAASLTTTDPKSLPADAKLYDLNGATDKIVDRGANTGGTVGTSSPNGTDPYPATSSSATTSFTDDGKSMEGKDSQGPRGNPAIFHHKWVGVGDGNGSAVYANLYSQTTDTSNKRIKLSDAGGKDITPDALKKGEPGIYNFSNGAQFVATKDGYFMINGDKAVNVDTGETKSASDVKAQLKKFQDAGNDIYVGA